MSKKRILFITGTRADFGKIKPLVSVVNSMQNMESTLFVTGMHTLKKYGNTMMDVQNNFKNTFIYFNQFENQPMEQILANTIRGLSNYLMENHYDMIVVHGDRVETLAAAIVGSFRNILVTHVEGGEVSGTIDELIRHSTSKLAHFHLVSNLRAKNRLLQMGENKKSIFIIGSPDIDVMLAEKLPTLDDVRQWYGIDFKNFSIVLFHPVTTEREKTFEHCQAMMEAIKKSGRKYIIIYPNNDQGADHIFSSYKQYGGEKNFIFFPSLRFEYFLVLLKNAQFIIGNSSAGVREAPIYGVPTINIGTRQHGRHQSETILNVSPDENEIKLAIEKACKMERVGGDHTFGDGKSAEMFSNFLMTPDVWTWCIQKEFVDII